MKHFPIKIISLLMLLLFGGCQIIGLRTNFSRDLTKEQQRKVVWDFPEDDFLPTQNDGRLYAINGKQMLKTIQQYPKVIVYQWSPHCSSEYCSTLSGLQTLCDQNGITLFVLADYFHDAFSQAQSLSNPLFIANERYYKTKLCPKLENASTSTCWERKHTTRPKTSVGTDTAILRMANL